MEDWKIKLRKSPRKKILGTKMRQSWYPSKTPNIKIMTRKRKLRKKEGKTENKNETMKHFKTKEHELPY